MTDLHGRTAIVTGAARDVGRAIAVRLGSPSASVVVNYALSVPSAGRASSSSMPALSTPGCLSPTSPRKEYDQLFAVNTKGAFFTLQMAARTVADNGRILYISSGTTGYPMPGYSVHGGSKIAPEYLVEVLAREAGAHGITVNTIRPTATEGAGLDTTEAADSPFRSFMATFSPMGRMGTPEDVANVVELFVSDLASFVSAQTLSVAGGALA